VFYSGMSAREVIATLAIASAVGCSLVADQARTASVPADKLAMDTTLVARGADLAAIGNCGACHTRDDGKPFAGGRPLMTPFGTIYSTNITPDTETGIGKWSYVEFLRAMHEGVDREGRSLYPAFPYDHFTRVTDNDVEAIYAFIMTRDPARDIPPQNNLSFPMSQRPMVSGWKVLFFERGVYRADSQHDAEWNRGAYLVEGLGHCGSCHTPRNAMGAEKRSRYLDGGDAEGWDAPALSSASASPSAWTAEQIYTYLRQGWDQSHGTAVGPMRPVAHDLSQVPESDVRAIARYVAFNMEGAKPPAPAPAPAADDPTLRKGETVFKGACASCHEAAEGGNVVQSTKPIPLAVTTSVNAPEANNAIHVILEGVWPESGDKGTLMPGFEGALTEDQLVSLLFYVRAHYGRGQPWSDLPREVRAIMQSEGSR
jgi:mono/diheme cytochrome c family protein